MNVLNATLWLSLMVYVLYHTGAVVAYLDTPVAKIFNRFSRIVAYRESLANGCDLSYSEYMQTVCDNFVVRLLACKYCFAFWMALATAAATRTLVWLPVVYFGGIAIADFFYYLNRKLNN